VWLSPEGSMYAYTSSGVCSDRFGVDVRSVAANGKARRIASASFAAGSRPGLVDAGRGRVSEAANVAGR
jgi:hypothetical protein